MLLCLHTLRWVSGLCPEHPPPNRFLPPWTPLVITHYFLMREAPCPTSAVLGMETSSLAAHPAAAHLSQAGPSSSVSETNMLVPGIPGLQPNIQKVLNQCSLNTWGRHLARHLLLSPFPGSSTVHLERNPTPSVYLNHLLQLSINEQHCHLGSCVQGIWGPLFRLPPPPSSQVIHHGFLCILHLRSLSYRLSSPPTPPAPIMPGPGLPCVHGATTWLPCSLLPCPASPEYTELILPSVLRMEPKLVDKAERWSVTWPCKSQLLAVSPQLHPGCWRCLLTLISGWGSTNK